MSRIRIYCLFILFVSGITDKIVLGLETEKYLSGDTIYNSVFEKDIHTVLLYNTDWEFSIPVIDFDRKLELHFDDLSATPRQFSYTLIHCSSFWLKSDISPREYLSGYGQGTIKEATPSINTTRDFIHYRLEFPEDDCMPVVSGNYAIVVFEDDDPEKVILTRRFYVRENGAAIEATARQPGNGQYNQTGQQINFNVNYSSQEIKDPHDITAVVMQNNRYDNMIIIEKPFTVVPGRLQYDGPDMGIFKAGNEFRSLDLKSMRYQTQNMAAIDFLNPWYHVYMKPDEDRSSKPYFSNHDLNGSYYIDREKVQNRHTEADYIYVHFSLKTMYLYAADNIYVTGAFCDWQHNTNNKMQYDESDGIFKATLLMKQGLYDYCYFKNADDDQKIDETALEGSYYETENDYAVFVYFHDQFKGCDRLIGYLSIK